MDLQTRFPITYALCEKRIKKYLKFNLITKDGVTYNKSVIPTLQQYQIDNFINLQNKYPEVINECFDNLIKILEEDEKINAGSQSNKSQEDRPMDKIYKLLTHLQLKESPFCDMMMIDKWVLFIKSQNEFSKFF